MTSPIWYHWFKQRRRRNGGSRWSPYIAKRRRGANSNFLSSKIIKSHISYVWWGEGRGCWQNFRCLDVDSASKFWVNSRPPIPKVAMIYLQYTDQLKSIVVWSPLADTSASDDHKQHVNNPRKKMFFIFTIGSFRQTIPDNIISKQESPPAWTQEAHCPPRSKCSLCCSV